MALGLEERVDEGLAGIEEFDRGGSLVLESGEVSLEEWGEDDGCEGQVEEEDVHRLKKEGLGAKTGIGGPSKEGEIGPYRIKEISFLEERFGSGRVDEDDLGDEEEEGVSRVNSKGSS